MTLPKLEFYRTHTLCALSTDCTVVAYAWRDRREPLPLPVHVTRQILGATTHLLTCVHVHGCRNNLVATLPGPPRPPGPCRVNRKNWIWCLIDGSLAINGIFGDI